MQTPKGLVSWAQQCPALAAIMLTSAEHCVANLFLHAQHMTTLKSVAAQSGMHWVLQNSFTNCCTITSLLPLHSVLLLLAPKQQPQTHPQCIHAACQAYENRLPNIHLKSYEHCHAAVGRPCLQEGWR